MLPNTVSNFSSINTVIFVENSNDFIFYHQTFFIEVNEIGVYGLVWQTKFTVFDVN